VSSINRDANVKGQPKLDTGTARLCKFG